MNRAKILVILLALTVIAGTGYGYFMHSQLTTPDFSDRSQRLITAGGVPLQVEVASSGVSRQQGLGGRDGLVPNTGMLFVFESDARWGFWMKDMKFKIDIVWTAEDGTIVTVAHDVSPDTYPEVFYPAAPARYVLELPAGFADAHNLAEGQKIMVQ